MDQEKMEFITLFLLLNVMCTITCFSIKPWKQKNGKRDDKINDNLYEYSINSDEFNIPPIELNALHFFVATGGSGWVWSNNDNESFAQPWNFSSPDPNPCSDSWVGVTCTVVPGDGYIHILSISLLNSNLVGSLPSTLNNLTYLTMLEVAVNSLSSSIPESLYFMSNLTYLDLSFNYFSQPLSDNIGFLNQLVYIDLSANTAIGGMIPESLYDITSVEQLYLGSCSLEGTISPNILNMVNLNQLGLYSNQLQGPIPQELLCNDLFLGVTVEDNALSGPLPYCDDDFISNLAFLFLGQNQLTGSIPAMYGTAFTQLQTLSLGDNQLHGTIPETIANALSIEYLMLNNNDLTGTFPEAIAALANIGYLDLSYNQLHGTVPEVLWQNIELQNLYLSSNQFSGTLSHSVGNTTNNYGLKTRVIVALEIDQNQFTGTLPSTISQMRLMESFFVDNNRFSGNLDGVFNATTMYFLFNVDVSSNQFTGTIPEEIFQIRQLLSFAAGSNCFSGSLPSNICGADLLSTLALDGLSCADSCQNRFFPRWTGINNYWPQKEMQGSIPTCLFTSLPYLSVLHLSGNGFAGTMPQLTYISENLTDLSLSGNNLKGEIPDVIQRKQWATNLDLSYNKLNGVLVGDFPFYGPNASLSLEVNRLSGNIPDNLRDVEHISMLNSNLFTCSANRDSLPVHDSDNDQFECGSNSVNGVLYAWFGLVAALILVVVALRKVNQNSYLTARNAVSQFLVLFRPIDGSKSGLPTLGTFLQSVRSFCYFVSVSIFCTMLIVNSALSVYFNSYTYEYAWNIASIFLSGVTPTVVLTIVFVGLSIIVCCGVRFFFPSRLEILSSENSAIPWSNPQLASLALIVLFNVILMVLVNVGYVVINNSYSFSVVATTQFLVALFKVIWNNYIVRFVLILARSFSRKEGEAESSGKCSRGSLVVVLLIVLFNNLAAPFIAIALISRSCFYDVITTPTATTLSYPYYTCAYFSEDDTGSFFCEEFYTVQFRRTISYTEPFTYDYQCCSTYISVYATIYIVMLIITSFVAPLSQTLAVYIMAHLDPRGRLYWLLNKLIPKLLRKDNADSTAATTRSSLAMLAGLNGRVFDGALFVVQLVNIFAVMLTFGVVFPPIAVLGCVSVLSVTWFTQLCIGRYLWMANSESFNDQSQLFGNKTMSSTSSVILTPDAASINEEALYVCEHFAGSLWVIVPFAALFYSFLLFDTLGDTEGWKVAMIMPIVVGVFVGLAVVMTFVSRRYTTRSDSGNSSRNDKSGSPEIELHVVN